MAEPRAGVVSQKHRAATPAHCFFPSVFEYKYCVHDPSGKNNRNDAEKHPRLFCPLNTHRYLNEEDLVGHGSR